MNDKQILKGIRTLIENSTNNKIKECEQIIIKKYTFKETYKLKKRILSRHFLIRTIKEINKKLKKDNKKF